MNKSLYDLMDWAAIEDTVYSEAANPHTYLGAHKVEEGILIQVFIPDAEKIEAQIIDEEISYEMERVDEAGFFALLLERRGVFRYKLKVQYKDGNTQSIYDAYSFCKQIYTKEDLRRFAAGVHYDIYEKMGAHRMSIDDVDGVYFSVWAPAALRVSVVGDFCNWDGRRYQMSRIGDSGIFEIFIPDLEQGSIYKYEIKTTKGEPMLKADPYAVYTELRPDTASIVYDIDGFEWTDDDWMDERDFIQSNGKNYDGKPLNILEVHLGSWMRKNPAYDVEGRAVLGTEFYNYREIAHKLAKYVKEMHYTHIELMPIMEHPLDASWGYQVTGYYSPTARYGTPKDFMYFINYMHTQNIGVILDWVPAHFPRDLHGLGVFDGTHVYEHADPRQGLHPHWGTYIFNYGRPQVSNFLIANALYWARYYHADGIRMDAVASMLYLDYGKNEGEWVANIHGGHENLEAIEFLKHLNSVMKIRHNEVLMIAEESTAWPKITGELREGGLGFDYKWNMGWMNDFLSYMKNDPYFRSHHYGALTFSMLYQYSENFILVLSHDEVVHGKSTLLNKMPGKTQEEKFANLRAAYGYMIAHPGKKLLFMGQEIGQTSEWNEDKEVLWELLEYPPHKQLQHYVKDLNQFYKDSPALWELDCEPEGFEWINCHSYEENIVAFLRKGEEEEDVCMVVCNFTPVAYKDFHMGIPYPAKLHLIFNSDDKKYGGRGMRIKKEQISREIKTDGKDATVTINIPPLSMTSYRVEKITEYKIKLEEK